ncbi:related to putative C2H2 zinc finger protein flbC [Sporisorium reilianum SRZ2]|uniref:Related to putative C2H2 zinc finger protein flbC n=1 Tax=Sporisorium reilianum (strain SRZ2) TaxID=999809 RepID=E6ZKW0_SPORE|nr:related to putative C2H2 zinc finger protein flbC [Sporisorium reilianum SRZ2]
MGPSGARTGIPFPGASSASSTSGSVRAASIPRSVADSVSELGETMEHRDMEVDSEPSTAAAAKRTAHSGAEPSTSLPSIKNLFGIERKEPLASVRRADALSDDGHSSLGTATPSSPAAISAPSQSLEHRGHRSHASTSSFSEFQSGLSHSSSSSSLGPIRTRHSSNASGSYGRSGPLVPSTPPRHAGVAAHPFSPEDAAGPRRRVDSRSRQAQALKGLILSPPSRRLPLDGDGPASDMHPGSQRRSGHRPASSSSGSLSTLFSHISTSSDPAPMLPPGYVPSTHTSEESVPHEGWGAASAPSDSTSPRTSWHSRSSTLESGEAAYKMASSDRPSGSLLPPFREQHFPPGEPSRYSPEQHFSSLSRHRSMRTPGSSANLPGSSSRPRARTLTHADRPIAPLPNTEDPARKQRLEAASELLRMGQQRGDDPRLAEASGGRGYSHKHSMSMQERVPLPMELYENASTVRTHRPKSHSMSGQEPFDPNMPMHHGPPGMPAPGLGAPPFDRGGPPPPPGGGGAFDSFHPRRGRGSGDEALRPGGAGWVFPRRPMPSEGAEAQRNAFQAQMMRGQGLASVPDGIISAQHGGGFGGMRAAPSTTGTIASGQAKYECAWCGKRFSRPSSLKIHHHSHTGEKPFVCNEPGCGRSFSVQSNLRRHQKCHAPGSDQSELDAARQQQGPGSSRGDEAYWARGPPPPAASSGARMSPIAGGSGGWHPAHPGYGPGPGAGGPAHGPVHAYGMGHPVPPPGSMPPQMQMQMQMHMHGKDHPPLSRSAYEPGSRSMNTWTGMRRGEMPPPTYRDYERTAPHAEAYISGSPRRFTQMREHHLSESSAEEEEEDELLHEDEPPAAPGGKADRVSESDDEADKTVTPSRPRQRSATSASTTSNLRAGFGALLNPEQRSEAPTRVKEEH